MTATIKTIPLSEFQPQRSLREFLDGTLYSEIADLRAREDRFAGDVLLIAELDRDLRGSGAPTVGNRPAFILEEIASHVQEECAGSWHLAGDDDSDDVISRIDAHFRDVQEAHARHCTQRDRAAEERARYSAEQDAQLEAASAENTARLWGSPVDLGVKGRGCWPREQGFRG